MANNFKRFKNGIQIRPSFSSDPSSGQVGEMYWNTARNVLRICTSTSPTWQDLFITDGINEGSVLRWNDTSKSWEENSEIRITSNTIFAENTAEGKDLSISGGQSTDSGVDGGDLVLIGGDSLGGGDKGRVVLQAGRLKFAANRAVDPVSGEEAEFYWNTNSKKFRFFDGIKWNNVEGLTAFFPIRLYDNTLSSLPPTDSTTIDGQTVVDGDQVLFTNLSANNNRVYRANVDGGGNITWTVVSFGQNDDGSPAHGDSVFVKEGDDFADTFWYFDSVAWTSFEELFNVQGVQEVPSGTIDGVNDTFTLAQNPMNAESLLVLIDGIIVDENDYDFLSPNTIQFAPGAQPETGQQLYAFYLERARPPVGTIQGQVVVEYFTLDSTDISNGFISLSNTPQNTNYVVLDVLTGTGKGAQEFDVDYTVSGTQLDWNSKTLSGELIAGDKLRVWYLI